MNAWKKHCRFMGWDAECQLFVQTYLSESYDKLYPPRPLRKLSQSPMYSELKHSNSPPGFEYLYSALTYLSVTNNSIRLKKSCFAFKGVAGKLFCNGCFVSIPKLYIWSIDIPPKLSWIMNACLRDENIEH